MIPIDWSAALTDIVSSLVVTLLTALVGFLFIQRYLSQITFSSKMRSYGFVNTSTNKQSAREIRQMCRSSKLIKIINVSGFHFLNANEAELKKALENGVEIRFLCSAPDSVFLPDIEILEYNQIDSSGRRMREAGNTISSEIWDLIEKYHSYGLNIRFYSTQYRLPYVLAYDRDGGTKAWLTMTLPPYKSTRAFVLRGERSADLEQTAELNFVDMMETNFDMIWEYGSKSLEEIQEGESQHGHGSV